MSFRDRRIFVIILNYNGWRDTIVCLETVLASDCDLRAIVVDNGSTDDSLKKISAWAESRKISRSFSDRKPAPDSSAGGAHRKSDLILIENGANLGFAAGNNVGIRHALAAGADYVFILNNDTKIQPNAIPVMLEIFRRNPDAGLVGPKILDFDGNYWQYPWLVRLDFFAILLSLTFFRRLALCIRGLKGKIWYLGEKLNEVYAIQGSAMMFSAEALENIGLLDEKTFLFYEEFIVAEKIRKTRFKTYFAPEAVISHKWSGTVRRFGAWKAVEHIKSEKYFVSTYLRLNALGKNILLFIRLVSYLLRIYDRSYRQNCGNFIGEFVRVAAGSSGNALKSEASGIVTVCIPVYNGARYLRETLDSVLSQDYPGLRVVVQDNASTDATPDILSGTSADKRISVFRNAATVSMAANWNICLSRAATEFVMLLSADDMLAPGFLRKAVEALGSGDADAFSSNHFWLREGVRWRRFSPVRNGVFRDFALQILLWNPFSVNFTLFRRRALLDVAGPGEKIFPVELLACDYDLWYRLAFAGKKIFYTNEPLGTYRLHGANLSASNPRKMRRHAVLVILRHSSRLKKLWPYWFLVSVIRFLVRELWGGGSGGGRDPRLARVLTGELTRRKR